MDTILIFAEILIFLFGIVIGSFLNVCIYRIPKGEDIVKVNSHCMTCGYQLKWYDLIPIFSYIFLRGKCRKCKTKLSCQYPIVEAVNGFMYVLIFAVNGLNVESGIYSLMASALLVLSVIDFRTYEIPFGINVFIFILACIHMLLDLARWKDYVIGFFAVSAFLYLLYLLSKGRAIGGGDIKLMAFAGLFLGWKCIILAFLIGCILGAVIHSIRMKVTDAEHVLAFGPYLCAGLTIAMLFGTNIINWYLSFMGF